jgi:Retron-type reverse transcriptase
MKRYGNLYEKVCDLENLRIALYSSSKTKKHINSVKRVLENEEKYLNDLRNLLLNEQFVNGKYHVFQLTERGKERTIHSLPFYPDRIIHHAIVQVCAPFWIKSFIRDTYASIPGRGIHDGVRRMQRIIPSCKGHYVLKCDITKFYPSVDHQVLKNILRRQIKDPKLLKLLDIIIDSGPGVPIGNYLSQYFGNLILNPFDHCIKEDKHIENYFRYCDDFVIIHESKRQLHSLFAEIKEKLIQYKLNIKGNWQVFPVDCRGIDFLVIVFADKTCYAKQLFAIFHDA